MCGGGGGGGGGLNIFFFSGQFLAPDSAASKTHKLFRLMAMALMLAILQMNKNIHLLSFNIGTKK